MTPQPILNVYADQLLASQDFFNRSTRLLEEADSEFRPQDGMMTAAQQIEHTAQTLDWFVEGATRPEGFDLNFEQHAKLLEQAKSISGAREHLGKAFDQAIAFVHSKTPEDLSHLLPAGPVMGGQPIGNIVWAMIEHTAHHRGALTVYTRMLGKTPPMPYFG